MTMNEMAESVHNMLADCVTQGFDAKDVKVWSVEFGCRSTGCHIYEHEGEGFASVWFSDDRPF